MVKKMILSAIVLLSLAQKIQAVAVAYSPDGTLFTVVADDGTYRTVATSGHNSSGQVK